MSSFLFKLGRGCARRPWTVIGIWVATVVIVIAASAAVGTDSEDSFSAPGVDSQLAVNLLSEAGSGRAGVTARVVVASWDDGVDLRSAPSATRDLRTVREALAVAPNVLDVSEAIASDGSVGLFTVQYPVLEELRPHDLERLKDTLREVRDVVDLRVEAGGELYFSFEEAAGGAAELVGLGAAVVILLVAFGSVVAMGLPIGIALIGLLLGFAAMPVIGNLIEIPSFAPQMAAMVGLGVGIDYALFLVTRHREFLADDLPVDEAAGRAVATAGQAVVFAGGTVVIAILGMAVAGLPFVTAMGVATSVTVGIMVVASITLLPALLGVVGHGIDRLRIHRRGGSRKRSDSGWQRWGAHVARHAWAYTIGVTGLLLALTAPVLALQLGFPDEGSQPESRTERRAYDLAADGFGDGINGPLVIAVDLRDVGGDRTGAELLASVSAAIEADPGVASIAPADFDAEIGIASIVALATTAPQDAATFDTVDRLRTEVFPSVVGDSGAHAHIGGQTANWGDVAGRVSDRLPWFIAAVVIVSFLLLMVVFRSVLVPLKAAVLNLLSIGAAYGVLVMVFQWGWGKELIGLESTVPIVSFIPMAMFAVLFGLSMDYEVFLLSRVREEYAKSGDNHQAVVAGLAGTARVITSAALIMISVFGAFALGDDSMAKMMGLGLATAIFVDATVVRVVLVPATMTLMGRANWWLPGWLDRRLPRVDIDGGAPREVGVTTTPGSVAERDRDGELVGTA